MDLMKYLPKEASTFVFQSVHGLCGLPYIAVVWQVAAWHRLL